MNVCSTCGDASKPICCDSDDEAWCADCCPAKAEHEALREVGPMPDTMQGMIDEIIRLRRELKTTSKCYYQRSQPCKEAHPLDPEQWCLQCGNDMKYYPPQGVGGAITYQQYYDDFVKKLKEL